MIENGCGFKKFCIRHCAYTVSWLLGFPRVKINCSLIPRLSQFFNVTCEIQEGLVCECMCVTFHLKAGSQYDTTQCVALRCLRIDTCSNTTTLGFYLTFLCWVLASNRQEITKYKFLFHKCNARLYVTL